MTKKREAANEGNTIWNVCQNVLPVAMTQIKVINSRICTTYIICTLYTRGSSSLVVDETGGKENWKTIGCACNKYRRRHEDPEMIIMFCRLYDAIGKSICVQFC